MRFAAPLLLSLLVVTPLAAQMDEHHSHAASSNERLGTVTFPVSCNAAAKAEFPRAVSLLHSFWYEESEKSFRKIATADPKCGMAWWGVAMSTFHPVWPSPYSPPELKRGIEAAKTASRVGAKTARERAYIDAIATFYRDAETVDTPTRARAYEAKMQALTAAFPDDDEAAIFYGLILINHGMAMPKDKTYAKQKEAAVLFNRLLAKYPDHPGIAHYLIHSFDYPALAPLALDAAYAYAKIAPSAPHALHMPSHIFVRLGMWPEAIQSNLASAEAARNHANHNHPGSTAFDALHAYDYLTYAWLQRGEDDKVQALVTELASTHALNVDNFAGYYALASVPARFALERRRWSDAAALGITAPDLKWQAYSYAESVTYFARAIGAARSGNPARAKSDVERLSQLKQKLADEKNAYWSEQVEIQRLAALGWIARAEGYNDDAIKQLSAAADLEDTTDKSPVTPGPMLPAREMLGDLLLEIGRPADALTAYEATLKGSPNRLNALTGAARAAQLAGDRAKAAGYYGAVQKLLAE
jgi:tetratricopeptide (TPR) repeat protein